MTWRRRNTGGLRSGSANSSKAAGMPKWMKTPQQAGWIFFSRKLIANWRKGRFASGRSRSEVRCVAPLLGAFQLVTRRCSRASRQKLPSLATRPATSFAPLPAPAGQRGSIYCSGGRSLSCAWEIRWKHDDVGLDWHAREVRSARWPVNRSAQDPQRLMPASFHSTPVPRACCGIISRVRCARCWAICDRSTRAD